MPAVVLGCVWDLGMVAAGSISGTLWHDNNSIFDSLGCLSALARHSP